MTHHYLADKKERIFIMRDYLRKKRDYFNLNVNDCV